jgi:outer membrane lipoprotein-sorting protein
MKTVLLALVLAVTVAACKKAPVAGPAGPAPASTTTPATSAPAAQPTAESIIEDHITATGGRAAREAMTSMRATGTMRMAKLGINGKLELMMKAPNLARVVVDIDGIGRTENGSDGTTVWEKTAMTGARILEGAERERSLRSSMLHADVKWRELYTKAELAGEVEFADRPAWKLLMTTPLGDVETHYYDRETKLALGKEEIAKTQMGELPTRSVYAEYKTYGALKMASRVIESTQGMDIEITIDSVELDPTLPADAFAVPADVAPLIKKK